MTGKQTTYTVQEIARAFFLSYPENKNPFQDYERFVAKLDGEHKRMYQKEGNKGLLNKYFG